MTAKFIKAAGGLVWRKSKKGKKQLAVIFRNRYGGEWGLPKGHLDRGEKWEAAALREVREETGCTCELEGFAGVSFYKVKGKPKIVLYWHMIVKKENSFEPSNEIQKMEWMSAKKAIERLAHEDERQLVRDNMD